MCACMYVWKYVCVYVCCMYVCMNVVSMYVCMYECMYVCMYVYIYVCMYICMYVVRSRSRQGSLFSFCKETWFACSFTNLYMCESLLRHAVLKNKKRPKWAANGVCLCLWLLLVCAACVMNACALVRFCVCSVFLCLCVLVCEIMYACTRSGWIVHRLWNPR